MKRSFPAVELRARIVGTIEPYKLLIKDKDVVQHGSHTLAVGDIKSCSLGLQQSIDTSQNKCRVSSDHIVSSGLQVNKVVFIFKLTADQALVFN